MPRVVSTPAEISQLASVGPSGGTSPQHFPGGRHGRPRRVTSPSESLDDPLDIESGGSDVYPVEQAAVAAPHRVQQQQQRVEQVIPALK